jgi:RNA polymerase sigma-70 factor (ECF subfamily)
MLAEAHVVEAVDSEAAAASGRIMSCAGKATLFEHELERTLDGLYGAALRLTKNRDDAEELVADTVAKAWAHRDSLHDAQCFRAWIFRILTNTFVSDWRKKSARPEELVDDDEVDDEPFSLFEQLHEPFLLWWGNPEQEFLNKLLREHLERAIDALPEAFRVVIVLAELEGFTYQEIGEMLQVPLGTVRSRLSRARGLLQKALWEDATEAGLVGRRPAPSN